MKISRPARIVLIAFLVGLAALGITVAVLIARFQPVAREYVVSTLRRQFHSDVEFGDLRVSLFPAVKATGDHLVLRLNGRKDVPPLMTIRRFTVEARLIGFFRYPKHIRRLRLEGLELHIPPRGSSNKSPEPDNRLGGKTDIPLIFEEVITDGTTLQTLPSDPAKDPLDFDIRELTLHHVGLRQPMTFHATLTNPKPPGLIHSDGRFGPWRRDDPSQTPVAGTYTFRDADLGVFHGISGTLSSQGEYNGQLDRIEVHGKADVPNFALSTAGRSMPLRTTFEVTVDGTDGDTILHPVRATLGKSQFEVSGAIERHVLEKHKTIALETSGTNDSIQDFLRLAMPGKVPMTGALAFRSHVVIPPGESDIIQRLRLRGTFDLTGVRFTSPDVATKLASLSNHALGKPQAETEPVSARLAGAFSMRAGAIALPALEFEVPGAKITLRGTYQLASGEIDMQGHARMQATVSQMTTGIKRMLLKPVDPLFRRNGAGAVLPIKIGGTRGQPSFKLDIGRALKRD